MLNDFDNQVKNAKERLHRSIGQLGRHARLDLIGFAGPHREWALNLFPPADDYLTHVRLHMEAIAGAQREWAAQRMAQEEQWITHYLTGEK